MAFDRQGSIHPDENLLAAFAELTLAPSERQHVLEHLSSCRHCRDVLFLAQQAAAEQEAQAMPLPDKSIAGGWWLGRRHWGIVLAGGAVAAMLIVTSLRLVHDMDRGHAPQPPAVSGTKTPAANQSAKLNTSENETAATPAAPTGSPDRKESQHPAQPPAGRETIPPQVTVIEPPNVAAASAPAAGSATGIGGGIGAGSGGGVGRGSGTAGNFGGPDHRAGVAGGVGGLAPAAPAQPQAQAKAQAKAPAAASSNTMDMGTTVLQVGKATTTVDVTAAQPALQNEDAQVSTSFTLAQVASLSDFAIQAGALQKCVAQKCSPVKSPSREPLLSVASDAGTVMAVDAKGALFISHNEGKHWKKSHVHWQGRAVAVSTAVAAANPPATDSADKAPAAAPVNGLASTQPSQLQIFQLQNDQGQVWLSSDEGKTWRLK